MAVLLLLAVNWPAAARAEGPPHFEPGVVLARFATEPQVVALESTLSSLSATVVGGIPEIGVLKIQVPVGSEEEAVAALKRMGAEFAQVNYLRRVALLPNDTYFSQQWALDKIKAPSAWDLTTGSSGITVAVVDTGIDVNHSDRPQNLLLGGDYTTEPAGTVTGDPNGHGTHVAGIVAARMNNGAGVAGVAPGVTLMAVRAMDATGSGTTLTTANGIIYAVDNGARVINLSLSGFDSSPTEVAAINYAYGKGALVVAAAGNCYAGGEGCEGQVNPITYPAALEHVLAVGATTSGDGHAYYSEAGPFVDLAAPGGDAASTSRGILNTCANPSSYCVKIGTSMAAPYAAGVAALAWSVNPNLTPDQVEGIVRQSAVDLGAAGRDDLFGYGRVDAYQAVRLAQASLGYQAQYVSQSFPATITVGQQTTVSVELRNTGGATWQRGGANPVRLGTSQPRDRASPFYTAGNWLSSSRPASLEQETVAPGQVGRFTFLLTGPLPPGTYKEYFQPVVEGQTWLDDPLIWFQVQVVMPPLPYSRFLPALWQARPTGW